MHLNFPKGRCEEKSSRAMKMSVPREYHAFRADAYLSPLTSECGARAKIEERKFMRAAHSRPPLLFSVNNFAMFAGRLESAQTKSERPRAAKQATSRSPTLRDCGRSDCRSGSVRVIAFPFEAIRTRAANIDLRPSGVRPFGGKTR